MIGAGTDIARARTLRAVGYIPPAPHTTAPVPTRRRWRPLLLLLAVMFFVTFGGFFFSGGTGGVGETDLERRIHVGDGMSIRLAVGWELSERYENPDAVLLSSAGGSLVARLPEVHGSPEELVDLYVEDYLEPESSRLTVGEPRPIELGKRQAVVARYSGIFEDVPAPVEGEIIAVVGSIGGHGVIDGWASEGAYAAVQPAIYAMARSVEVW
jgi:hypothetical protein